MNSLICNIADNLIRKIVNEEVILEKPLDEVWYVQPYANTREEIELSVPEMEVAPIENDRPKMKWKNPADGKWYKIKIRPDFPRRYIPETGLIETVVDKIPENLEEEIL